MHPKKVPAVLEPGGLGLGRAGDPRPGLPEPTFWAEPKISLQ